MKKTKVIFLLGPTGCGKTSLAINLAKDFDGEIISADSVQVFKEFNIGSAKVTDEEKQGVKHYGIDIKSPSENFSASEYVDYTKACIEEISAKGKLPIIAGGTGLYVKALVSGYNFGGTAANQEFREEMERLIEKEGLQTAIDMLEKLSPSLLEGLDTKNKARVIRALEIAKFGSGKTSQECQYDFKILAANRPRAVLYERINKRVDIMVKDGLFKEVEELYNKYGPCQPMSAIGYKETLSYITGKADKEETIEKIKQNTRHYAKRQLTFIRGLENVEHVEMDEEDSYKKLKENIKKWLSK